MASMGLCLGPAIGICLSSVGGVWLPAGPPAPVPAWYVAETLEQPVDHFNAENGATFSQRFLVNASWWRGPPWPIILYTGAEGSGVPSIFAHSGWVLDVARELSALAVFAEMRFFGASVPFGAEATQRRADRLGLLSVEQTLADDAALVAELKRRYAAEGSKVVALGGSLAGTLAFMLRAKYPSVVQAALASSAPVLGYAGVCDPYGWYRVATNTFERQAPGCPARVRAAFADLLAAPPAEVSKAYNTCTPALAGTGRAIASRLTDQLAAMAEAAYPRRLSPVVKACAALGKGAGAFRPLVVPMGRCLNVTALAALRVRAQTHIPPPPGAVARGEGLRLRWPLGGDGAHETDGGAWALGADKAAIMWFYLACTEVVHPIAANNVTDMFPPRSWDAAALSDECVRLFGVRPRLHWLPQTMGMAGGPKAIAEVTSRVIFSSGLLDPWSAQSVLQNVSDTVVAVTIADGSHHSDLGGGGNPRPSAEDSLPLRNARSQELDLLRAWLAPAVDAVDAAVDAVDTANAVGAVGAVDTVNAVDAVDVVDAAGLSATK